MHAPTLICGLPFPLALTQRDLSLYTFSLFNSLIFLCLLFLSHLLDLHSLYPLPSDSSISLSLFFSFLFSSISLIHSYASPSHLYSVLTLSSFANYFFLFSILCSLLTHALTVSSFSRLVYIFFFLLPSNTCSPLFHFPA